MDSIKIFLSTIFSVLEITSELIFFYLIRVYFNVEIIGQYGAILSFFSILTFLVNLGIWMAHLKYYSEAKELREKEICNGTFLFIKFIQFLIFIVIIISLIPIINIYEGDINVLYAFLFFHLLSIFSFLFNPLFLSEKQILKKTLPILISTLLRIILLIIVTNFIVNNIWMLIQILIAGYLIYFTLNIILLKNYKFKKPTREYLNKYFKYSYPFFISLSLNQIITNFDIVFVKYWFPIIQVANYFTAKQIFTYLLILIAGVESILMPTFTKNLKLNKDNLNLIEKVNKYLTIIILPLILLITLYSSNLFILIFGTDYYLLGVIMTVLSIDLIQLSIYLGNFIQLKALGRIKIIASFGIVRNILNLIFLIISITPPFQHLGVIGAAIAYTFSGVVSQLIFAPIIYYKYKLPFYWKIFKTLSITLLIFIFQIFINSFISIRLFLIPIFIVVNLGIYLLLNFLFKGLNKEDIKFLLNLFSIKNIKKIINSELTNEF